MPNLFVHFRGDPYLNGTAVKLGEPSEMPNLFVHFRGDPYLNGIAVKLGDADTKAIYLRYVEPTPAKNIIH